MINFKLSKYLLICLPKSVASTCGMFNLLKASKLLIWLKGLNGFSGVEESSFLNEISLLILAENIKGS